MWNWLKNLLSKLLRAFKKFIDTALPIMKRILIAQFQEFAITTVSKLNHENISNGEKRRKAFEAIKAEAMKRGKILSDSLINILIELAVSYLKNALR